MKIDSEKLSAFLDGELTDAETHAVEAALAKDPALQQELEGLMAANQLATEAFETELSQPSSPAVVAAIRGHESVVPANSPFIPTGWSQFAAAIFVALCVGVGAGYLLRSPAPTEVASARGWLDDIADYHGVYAQQTRHLVEFGAEESDHIETWLTNSVGVNVRIPDLQASGLTFEGGRLVVASGRPVAQLIYTDDTGQVVALCLLRYVTPNPDFTEQTVGGFDMVTWGANGAYYVVVGDEGRPDLLDIAKEAAVDA